MSRRPHPGRRGEQEESELDQFEAYGSYSYEYMHHPQEEEEGGEDEYDDPYAHGPRGVRRVPIGRERPVAVKKRSFWGRLLFLVVCAVVALIVLQGTVFRLQYVYVVGNEKKSKEEIVMASGLVRGLNIFAVSEEEIRRNLGKDHTLQFLRIQKELPSTVYLYVSERLPVAAIQCRGLMYTLDDQGLVMEESSALALPEGMPFITGFQVVGVHVGQPLEVKDPRQTKAFRDMMSELHLQMYTDQVSELNLFDPDNLYLITLDGITVRLGTGDHMRAKIGALRTDMAYLRQLGKNAGILDVSIPEDAKYMPEN